MKKDTELSSIMEKKILYRIRIKTLEGRILTYNHVKDYINWDGLISFNDAKNGALKIFSSANCEIEEE